MKKITPCLVIALFLYIFTDLPVARAYCPPNFAHITSIEPNIKCLNINATRGCGGEIEIINECLDNVIFEGITIPNKDAKNNSLYYHNKVNYYGDGEKNWVLTGKMKDQAIKITGKTVYENPDLLPTLWRLIKQLFRRS